jgi:hypothetical protein
MVAVGMPVTQHPPHRSRRAALPHRAPASGDDAQVQSTYRTQSCACGRVSRLCVRPLWCSTRFPLASPLLSTPSASPGAPKSLFGSFVDTMGLSDSLHPCITGVPRGFPVRTWPSLARPEAGPPGFRTPCCGPCRGRRPRRGRRRLTLTASTLWPAACAERVGTQDKRRLRGSLLCLSIPLSTLRAYRYRYTRMTRGQCGGLDLYCLGLTPFTTVPACPGADPNAALQARGAAGAT